MTDKADAQFHSNPDIFKVWPFEEHFEEGVRYGQGQALPGIWITDPHYNDEGEYVGRGYVDLYDGADDPDGQDALYYGGTLYDEAMSVSDPELALVKLALFCAAELLYLHAASKGNPVGHLCLGYVYYYDRCQGHYWDEGRLDYSRLEGNITAEEKEELVSQLPSPDVKALAAFERASQAGLAEGSYKLGDCHKNGRGCDEDPVHAYQCYQLAMEQDDGLRPYLSGSIALRLAGCLEEGLGCTHDFRRALTLYQTAADCLDAAVRCGDWYYRKALRGARDGVARCKQEVDLEAQG